MSPPDASTNIVPLGLLIGGEELHNNHQAYPTSAKLSMKWYEFDIGWFYIRLLEAAGMARVKHVAPHDAFALQTVEPSLKRDERLFRENERARLAELLPKSHVLQTMVAMRHELAAVWERSMVTHEQFVAQLQDWCRRAETSQIKPLAEFSRQLRCCA